ncbi:Gnk2-homologous domain [Sesbania bispinosa]|nr:Gnk2-homologous domain [Sesbania bispinosa]
MLLFNTLPVSKVGFLLLCLFGWLTSSISAAPNYNAIYCPNNATYKSNNTFQTNLNVLLSSLISNATLGVDSYSTNAVNGLFLCRGDVSSATCQECVATSVTEITRLCPNQTESIIWYDECMLRYTNRYFSPTSIIPRANLRDDKNISTSDLESFNEMLSSFLSSLATEAARSQTAKKFATEERNFTASSSQVYGLAQCAPGLTNAQCEECLVNASRTLVACCEGKQGARALLAWCNIRYEMFQFYNTSNDESAPSPPVPPPPGNLTQLIGTV